MIIIAVLFINFYSDCTKSVPQPVPASEDDAVAKERQRVLTTNSNEDLLILRNLTKRYGTRHKSQYRVAVNQLCLRMRKAEVCYQLTRPRKYCLFCVLVLWLIGSKWCWKDIHIPYADW